MGGHPLIVTYIIAWQPLSGANVIENATRGRRRGAFPRARVPTNSGVIDASVFAYQWDQGRVFYFVMLTQGGYGIQPFAGMVNSLRRITPAEAAAIRPRIIHIETVGPADTVQSLASRMAYRDFRLERFLSLNGLAPNSRLVPGQRVKLVVYGRRS